MNSAAFIPGQAMSEALAKLPHNFEAEHAMLGAGLFDDAVVRRARDRIRPEHFFEPFHGRLWAAMVELVEANKRVDPVVLMERLKNDPAFEHVGGIRFLADLADRAPTHPGLEDDYGPLIFDCAVRRSLIDVSARAAKAAAEHDAARPAYDLLVEVKRELEAVEQAAVPDDGMFTDAQTAGDEALEEIEAEIADGKVRGSRTGLSCIDRRLGGLMPEDLIIIAGRPGMGKTALLGNVMYGAAQKNSDRLFATYSLEMGKRQLSARALSRLTADDDERIPYTRIGKNDLTPMDLQRLHEVKRFLPSNLLLRDRAGVGLEEVERAVWALKRKGKLAAVGIDYLQIMRKPKANGRNETSVIGEITTGLKTLAREAKITIILLSQLSRAVEQREDKRPQLSDLKDSGSIEQDADAVLFPYREVYYLERTEPKPGTPDHREWQMQVADLRRVMEVGVAKNRHGGVGAERQDYEPEVDLVQNVRGGHQS